MSPDLTKVFWPVVFDIGFKDRNYGILTLTFKHFLTQNTHLFKNSDTILVRLTIQFVLQDVTTEAHYMRSVV